MLAGEKVRSAGTIPRRWRNPRYNRGLQLRFPTGTGKRAAILVLPGMSLNDASQSLDSAGFDFGDNYLSKFQGADLLCSRTRSHSGFASCVQCIFLTAATRNPAKVQVAVWQPSCTGP